MSNKLKKVLLGTAVLGAVIAGGIAYLKKSGKKCCCRHSDDDADDNDMAESTDEECFDADDAFANYDDAERTYVEITPTKDVNISDDSSTANTTKE